MLLDFSFKKNIVVFYVFEPLFDIKSAKLKDIMKTFTKYFGDSIVIQNKEVEHYKYTGKFRQSRGVINALRLLQKDAPFTKIGRASCRERVSGIV